MKTIEKIRKMMKYLSLSYRELNATDEEIKQMKMRSVEMTVAADTRPFIACEHQLFILRLDGESFKVSYYEYDESHHNGDHEDCTYVNSFPADFEEKVLRRFEEDLLRNCRQQAERALEEQAKEEHLQRLDDYLRSIGAV